jgi:hypothetical protein
VLNWLDRPTNQMALGMVTGFPEANVEEVVVSSARARSGQITEGARAIAKKLGHAGREGYKSAFDGIAATQENAATLIRDIMSSPVRVM